MREEKRKQFRCIETATAGEFQNEIQKIYDEHPNAVVTFHQVAPKLAYVEWTETVRIKETLEDEFQEQGVQLYCSDCPFYEYPTDMRRKWTRCSRTGLPVKELQRACEVCYQSAAGQEVKE